MHHSSANCLQQRSFSLILLLFSFYCCCLSTVDGLSSAASAADLRRRLPGIWKLHIVQEAGVIKISTIVETLVNPNQGKSTNDRSNDDLQEIMLKIQDDGSFRQCDEGYQEGKWMSGRWELLLETECAKASTTTIKMCFAMNRQYFGPPHDSLLTGGFDNDEESGAVATARGEETINKQEGNDDDDSSSIMTPLSVSGTVSVGKFKYPKKHTSFFAEPILITPEITGNFQMIQMLSFSKMAPAEKNEKDDASKRRFE